MYSEIPTIPSNVEAIIEEFSKAMSKLTKIDFERLGKDLPGLVQTANKGLSQIPFDQLGAAIKGAADSINGLASSPDLKQTLVAAHGALDNLSKTLVTLQAQIDPVGNQLVPNHPRRFYRVKAVSCRKVGPTATKPAKRKCSKWMCKS